jgi:transcriptional regulator with XRE-family HTH domain
MEPVIRLRELRESRQITQAELARALDVDRSYVSRLEQGERLPAFKMILQLARFFRVGFDDLIVGAPGRTRR